MAPSLISPLKSRRPGQGPYVAEMRRIGIEGDSGGIVSFEVTPNFGFWLQNFAILRHRKTVHLLKVHVHVDIDIPVDLDLHDVGYSCMLDQRVP